MRLNEAKVAIVGLGLMGGSLALALGNGLCKARIGVARKQETADQATHTGVVDRATTDLQDGVREADIVVLAMPVRAILSSIQEVGTYMRTGALLMDLGSTKAEIVSRMDRLPEHVEAAGGHPMCGKETGGLEQADASLFRGAVFALTPTARTTHNAISLAQEMVEAIGARPLILDAERHDRAVACTSHLPYLLAASLTHVEAEAEEQDPVVGMLAASGFRDTTRLTASEVPMMLDILLTNRQAIEQALGSFERQIARARSLLDDPAALEQWMKEAQCKRREMFG